MSLHEKIIERLADEICELRGSNLSEANRAAKRAAAEWPDSAVLQSLKADIFVRRRNFDAAFKALERGRRCPPLEMKSQIRLARIASTLGRYQAAHALVQAGLARRPKPHQAMQLAVRLIDIGDYEAALDVLAEVEEAVDREVYRELSQQKLQADRQSGVDPEDKRLWSAAMDQLRQGRPELAEPRLAELTRRAPGYAPGWIGLRGALIAQGQNEAARALEDRWTGSAPGAGPTIAAGMGRRLSLRGLLFDPREPMPLEPKEKALARVGCPEALKAAQRDAWLPLDVGGQVFRHAPTFVFDRLHPEPITVTSVTPQTFVASLRNPLLVGRGVPVTAGGALVTELTSPGLDKSDLHRVEDRVAFDWRHFRNGLCPIRCFDEPAFLLAGPHDCGFGDWIINFPPRLALAQAANLNAKIVISDQAIPTAEPMLAALGVGPARLIRHDSSGVSLFPRLYVPSWPMRQRLNHMPEPFAIYRRAALPPPADRPRLYLSREGINRRRLLNEPQVRALFELRGFRCVRTEQMTFEQARELFAGPACVAGPYGSALLNLVFASNRPACLFIAPPEPVSFLQEAISWLGAMELPFGYIRGELPAEGMDEGWLAPLDLVEQGLEALLELEGA
jgi:capsular polysaccharide biosynthesis protein/tetratricopeptide (TPR) repeat protein